MNKRFALTALALLVASTATACGEQSATTSPFINDAGVSALVGLDSGGVRYAVRTTGDIWDADASGKKASAPTAHVDVRGGEGETGLLSLAVDEQQRTFASWVSADGMLKVGQVAPEPTRVIWDGPRVGTQHVGGDLSFTPTKRLLIAVGDLNQPTSEDSLTGKLLTLDPNRDASQPPNAISAGWHDPSVVLYDQSGTLWAGQVDATNTAVLNRLSNTGAVASSAPVLNGGRITGLTRFGEEEFAACLSGSHSLTRYLIRNRDAVPGRSVATDCTGDVAQLKNGTLAYVSATGIRVTAK